MTRTALACNSPYARHALKTFTHIRDSRPSAEIHHLVEELGTTRAKFIRRLAGEFTLTLKGLGVDLVHQEISLTEGHPELNRRIGPLINLLNYSPPRDYSVDRDVLYLVLDSFNHSTFMHSLRVSDYSMKMARHLRLTSGQENTLALASRLHDMGKVAIPTDILEKPDRLDSGERERMNMHQIIGYLILRGINSLREVAEVMAFTHIESGYPEAFVGRHIPLLSHVLIVSDTFDACLSYREYRHGVRMPMSDVFEEIVINHTAPRHPLNVALAAALAYEIEAEEAKRILSLVYSSPDEAKIIDEALRGKLVI